MAVNRQFFGIVLFLWIGMLSGCGGPRIEDLGHPFKNTKLKINWSIPTNPIPSSINVFNVSAARWNLAWLSNVVALGEFENHEEVMAALRPALKGLDANYTDDAPRGSRKSLIINPSKGRFLYYREGVIALPKQPIESIPSEGEALRSALALFPKLGLSQDELRRRPGNEEIHYARDLTTRSSYGNPEKKVIARGLYLVRAIEGIGINGVGTCGGMRIRFGSHGKIAELELVWRNIHSPHAVPAADTNQIAEWIRRGKATIETDAAPASIKRLTITNANIFYLGHNGSEHQSRMYPFVNLGAIAEVNSRQVSVSVNCPITSD